MIASPEISISADEPCADKLGQFWSPATVNLAWPSEGDLPGPRIQVSVIAPIRGQMTVDELRATQIQAAHDVLNAALLSIEGTPKVSAKRASKVG